MANMLYNGVELPELPDSTYAYANIRGFSDGTYQLTFTNKAGTYKNGNLVFPSSTSYKGYQVVKAGATEWGSSSGSGTWWDGSSLLFTFLWANYDVLNEDGTVYLAASDPVDPNAPVVPDAPVTPGSSGNGDGMALYNGVMLPNINTVWTDKETYPYAVIETASDNTVCLVLMSNPIKCEPNNDGTVGDYLPSGTSMSLWLLIDGVWSHYYDNSGEGPLNSEITFLWANHDVLTTTDGSVCLAASDPISLDGMNVITWDGDPTGKEFYDDFAYCKVSDNTPSATDLVGGYIALRVESLMTTSIEITSDMIVTDDSGAIFVYESADAVASEGKSPVIIVVPSDGVGFFNFGNIVDSFSMTLAYPTSSGTGSPIITETLGDGFALYNGVKLPKLPEWEKVKYPHALITEQYGITTLLCTSVELIYYEEDGMGAVTNLACSYYSYIIQDGEWIYGNSYDSAPEMSWALEYVPWSNYDIFQADASGITDTVYLAASDPISLDGMKVIEWDGDTNSATDLSGAGMDGLYMVSDTYIDFDDGDKYICVIWNGDEYVTYPQHTELNLNIESLDGEKAWSLGATGVNMACGFNMPSQSLVGTAFLYTGDAENNIRTTLLAYQAAASSGNATPQSDWMKGYIVGKALAKSMPYRAVEKDILDNTWPIQFNTLAVANNSTKLVVEETEIVKISNLTLDEEEAMGLTVTVTIDGVATPLIGLGAMHFDIGSIVMFGTNFSDAEFGIVSVTSTQASEDMYGFSFPATGLYTILPVKDGEPINATIALKQGVAPKYFFDSFPLDLKFTPAYFGQFLSLESAPLMLEDGSQNGAYMKISNMTPTLEELSAMNFSVAAASCIDGVVGEVDSSPTTAEWDPTGQFVKLDGASIIIVYEAKTINTTPFDVDTPATVTLTPGIWLTDGYTFALVFVIASMVQGNTNDSCADDYMRIVYGSAEDAKKVLEEYGVTEINEE